MPLFSDSLAPKRNPGDFHEPVDPEKTFVEIGAGEAIRTPDPHLGKVMLYP
jgi:hypothetical protein